MNEQAEMDVGRQRPGRSRGAWGFSAGVLVGLGGAIAGLTLAVAAQRRRRHPSQGLAEGSSSGLSATASQSERWQAEQAELDEELDQTFPASDPLPQSHRVD